MGDFISALLFCDLEVREEEKTPHLVLRKGNFLCCCSHSRPGAPRMTNGTMEGGWVGGAVCHDGGRCSQNLSSHSLKLNWCFNYWGGANVGLK